MDIINKHIFAKKALLPNGWSNNVIIEIDQSGLISNVTENNKHKVDAYLNEEIILPAMNNLHSHSFQRAMAGLTEARSPQGNDNFWSWRNLMYQFLDVLTPEEIYSITLFSQMEMLQSGYVGVGEFHYLHNQIGGTKYDNIAELSEKVLEASEESGISICLLPVIYERGGCDNRELEGGQLRFHNNIDTFEKLYNQIKVFLSKNENFSLGVAAHSLRAVKNETLNKIIDLTNGPIHIHAAEQVKEVEEIKSFYKMPPVEFLIENFDINKRWCLIHCTQMSESETELLSKSGAVAGLCPVTEANLGDGIFNGFQYNERKGLYGIGTDSNINISLTEELKTFEYSQRLLNKKRAVISNQKKSTGRKLFDDCLEGGARALQINNGKIQKGFNADLISLPNANNELDGLKDDKILDYWIFASRENDVQKLWNKGKCLVENGKHLNFDDIQSNYRKTIKNLQEKL